MAEKVPSFKSGGAYWFVDLSSPDTLYIFPLLTALTFLATVEVDSLVNYSVLFSSSSCFNLCCFVPLLTCIDPQCNMQEGMEGNPAAGTMKNVSRVLAFVSVPLTMGFPKVIL